MSDLVNTLINGLPLIAIVVALGVVFYVRRNINSIRPQIEATLEATVEMLPDDLEKAVRDALKIGADFAESIDLDGQLEQFLDEFTTKSEAKLNLAVETAAQWLEIWLEAHGLKIDIPEELLKRLMNAYIFNNRETYPTGDVTNSGTV